MITKKQGEEIAKRFNSIQVSRMLFEKHAEELTAAIKANDSQAIAVAKARCKLWIDAEIETMDRLISMGIPVISYAETKELQKSYSGV